MVYRDIVKVLKKAGWKEVAVKGSHHQFKDSTGKTAGKATVPYHGNKELSLKTLKNMLALSLILLLLSLNSMLLL